MERFESVFDNFDVKYAEIEEREDYENEMDGLDRIEIMRERVEARVDEYYNNVYEFYSCKNEKNMDSVEQDDLEIIWDKIRQDYNTWSEITRQGNDWCVNSIQVDGDLSVVDRSQVV